MTLKDGSAADYKQAATRHYLDAVSLHGHQRWDNAGHLIGFAAECAIKYKISSLRDSPSSPRLHLPELLSPARKLLGERANFTGMFNVLKGDVFHDWSVDFRYAPDGKVSKECYEKWLLFAQRLLAAANIRVRLP